MREENRIEYGRNRVAIGPGRRVSWSAIFAGVAVVFGVATLLGLLGAGFGAGSVNPLTESHPFRGLGIAALIWMAVTGIIAFFIGGWVSGYSGWAVGRTESLIHGLVMWSVATLVAFWVMTGAAGALLSGAGLVGQTVTGGVQAAPQSQELSERIREELARRGITAESLRERAQNPEVQARADEMARQAGQAIATGLSRAAWSGFALLLLDLIFSLLGAAAAAQHRRRETAVVTERAA